jgi:hypothetical protein
MAPCLGLGGQHADQVARYSLQGKDWCKGREDDLRNFISTVKQLNHANLLILSSWVAESLDKCVCPKQGTPKSSGLNCNFEGVDTIGMHTWSVYRQIVASSFDHLIMFFVFDHYSKNLKGLEAVHTLLSVSQLAWAQAYSCSSARSPWLQKVMCENMKAICHLGISNRQKCIWFRCQKFTARNTRIQENAQGLKLDYTTLKSR